MAEEEWKKAGRRGRGWMSHRKRSFGSAFSKKAQRTDALLGYSCRVAIYNRLPFLSSVGSVFKENNETSLLLLLLLLLFLLSVSLVLSIYFLFCAIFPCPVPFSSRSVCCREKPTIILFPTRFVEASIQLASSFSSPLKFFSP